MLTRHARAYPTKDGVASLACAPRIHLKKEESIQEDGLPGQARQ
jgi:hypothetical protein